MYISVKKYNEKILYMAYKNRINAISMVESCDIPNPKLGDWNLNLNKTRLITLLECPRKLFMKILINRISYILMENRNVLGDNNYVALPGKLTIELIHILNNVMEKAREKQRIMDSSSRYVQSIRFSKLREFVESNEKDKDTRKIH